MYDERLPPGMSGFYAKLSGKSGIVFGVMFLQSGVMGGGQRLRYSVRNMHTNMA